MYWSWGKCSRCLIAFTTEFFTKAREERLCMWLFLTSSVCVGSSPSWLTQHLDIGTGPQWRSAASAGSLSSLYPWPLPPPSPPSLTPQLLPDSHLLPRPFQLPFTGGEELKSLPSLWKDFLTPPPLSPSLSDSVKEFGGGMGCDCSLGLLWECRCHVCVRASRAPPWARCLSSGCAVIAVTACCGRWLPKYQNNLFLTLMQPRV